MDIVSLNSIVGQKYEYPDPFILEVNDFTGVLKGRIKTMYSSLHDVDNDPAFRDVAKVLVISAFTLAENGKNNLRSKILSLYADKVAKALKVVFKEMDTYLMPKLEYGGKQFSEFSYPTRRKLKFAVLFAIAYQLSQANKAVAIH